MKRQLEQVNLIPKTQNIRKLLPRHNISKILEIFPITSINSLFGMFDIMDLATK
jgi:hypothetical protein